MLVSSLIFSPFLPFQGSSDFRVFPIGPISLSSFQTGSLQLRAEVDCVALEPVESFFLTIALTGEQIPAKAFGSRNAFFYGIIKVLIEDASGKCLLLLA